MRFAVLPFRQLQRLFDGAELAAQRRVQYTPGTSFYVNGGGEEFIRLAFSYEPADRCYEGARLLAQAILEAR